jgi:hypothetical protein
VRPHDSTAPTLADLGISCRQSSRWQQLADVPEGGHPGLWMAVQIRVIPARGQKLARDLPPTRPRQKMLAGSPLSMPRAAEGGGRRPAFTGDYQPVTIGHRDRWLSASDRAFLVDNTVQQRTARRSCAGSCRRQQGLPGISISRFAQPPPCSGAIGCVDVNSDRAQAE